MYNIIHVDNTNVKYIIWIYDTILMHSCDIVSAKEKQATLNEVAGMSLKNEMKENNVSDRKIRRTVLLALLGAVIVMIGFTVVFISVRSARGDNGTNKRADADTDELTFSTQLLQYIGMTYGQFKQQTGAEAEFYHGLYFQAPIPGEKADVVFQGIYDEDVAGSVLSDEHKSFRVETSLNNIISGITSEMTQEMTVAEFMEMLDTHAGFTYSFQPEILEGLTGYYVAYHYVMADIDSDGDGTIDILLKIALNESDHISPDASTWIENEEATEDTP